MVDFAAAGILRGYARLTETTDSAGHRTETRDSRIPRDLWRRIARARLSREACTLPAIRLEASSIGNLPEVVITGIRFDDRSLAAAIEQHGGAIVPCQKDVSGKAGRKGLPIPSTAPEIQASQTAEREPTRPTTIPLPVGTVLVTVKQAMSALGMGRTKINALMNEGRLVRVKIDGAARIEVESIRALMRAG